MTMTSLTIIGRSRATSTSLSANFISFYSATSLVSFQRLNS